MTDLSIWEHTMFVYVNTFIISQCPWSIGSESCVLIGYPNRSGLPTLIPRKKQIWNGHTSAIELQKAAEDTGNINDSHGFVLQTQLALFPASRNKQFSVHKIGKKKTRPVSSHLDIDLVNNAYIVTSIHRGKCCWLCLLSCPTEQTILKESAFYYLRVTWCFSWGR